MLMTESARIPGNLYGWAYLGFYGTLTFASSALYNNALAKLPTTLVAISGYGQPVIASGLAILLLGEIPSIGAVLGALVVIAGLALATGKPE